MRIVVVFPLPLGPMKPKTLPSGTLRERSSTAVTSPKVLVTLEISTAGISMVGTVFQSGISLGLVQQRAPKKPSELRSDLEFLHFQPASAPCCRVIRVGPVLCV